MTYQNLLAKKRSFSIFLMTTFYLEYAVASKERLAYRLDALSFTK